MLASVVPSGLKSTSYPDPSTRWCPAIIVAESFGDSLNRSTSNPSIKRFVCVSVTNEGTDGGQLPPMLDQIEERYGKRPGTALVDCAYATKAFVEESDFTGTAVVSTVPRSDQLKRHGKDPHQRQKGDSDEYEAFRHRMADPEYQELSKKRPSIAGSGKVRSQ